MTEYQGVAKVGDIEEGTGMAYAVNGRMVAVFRENDKYFAIDDMCPHMGASLAPGYLQDGVVTCPWHGWQFDVETGAHKITARIKVGTYPVEIDADGVWVILPEEQSAK